MPDPVRQYTDEIHDASGYLATWLPGDRITLGDCGPLDHHVFTRERDLSKFGYQWKPGPKGAAMDVDYASQGKVTVSIQLKGENKGLPNVPAGKAGIDINFEHKHAVVLVLKQAVEQPIDDLYQLQRDLLDLYRREPDRWPKDYVVVSSVVTAASGTVLIADSDNSHFAVTADADLKAGIMSLADASIDFSVSSQHQVSTRVLAQEELTPLFRAFRIKKDFWGRPHADALAAAEEAEIGSPDSPFEWTSQADASLERFALQPALR